MLAPKLRKIPGPIPLGTIPLIKHFQETAPQARHAAMPHIIAEPCVNTKDTACVEVCPVDCIHPTKDDEEFEQAKMLYINPDECIDCGACIPECPVDAIFDEVDLPDQWQSYIKINEEWFDEH